MVGVNFGKTTLVKNKEAFNKEVKLRNRLHKPITKEAIIKIMKKLDIPKKEQL